MTKTLSKIPKTKIQIPEESSGAWFDRVAEEAWEEAMRRHQRKKQVKRYTEYQQDPVGFCEDVLGEFITEDIKAVMESVRDNPVTIAKSANGPGKTHGAGRIAAWFYKVYPECKIYLTSAPPLDNLKKLLWGEVVDTVKSNKAVFADDALRSMQISRTGVKKSSFVTCVTIPMSGSTAERQAKFSGKHASHMLFIVDEGDAVPPEVYTGIEQCMSGGFVRLLVMFNPKQEAGPVYQMEKTGRANVITLSAFNHPNVKTGKNVIPGAVDREVTVRRINEWTRPLADNEEQNNDCFEVPDFLVGVVAKAQNGVPYPPLEAGIRKITETAFSYMVLGEYPAQGVSQLISAEWIERAVERWKQHVATYGEKPLVQQRPRMGVDIAELGTDRCFVCLRYGDFVPRFYHAWTGVDADKSAVKSLELYREKDVEVALIDGTGVGAAVAPSMVRMGRGDSDPVRAVGVKVAGKPTPHLRTELGEFYMLREQLYWSIREWMRKDTAMLPPDPFLIDELKAIRYYVDVRGKVRITAKDDLRSMLKRSPDRADALSLTFAPYERPKIITLQD